MTKRKREQACVIDIGLKDIISEAEYIIVASIIVIRTINQ